MTADKADGIDEDLTRAVGMAMIAASRAGEQLTRMKQAADRERQARATGNAQQAERELVAHTEAARAYFEVVTRPEYLHTATDAQIRGVTQQAEAWRERLPEAQRAAAAATAELRARGPASAANGPQRAAVLAGQAEATDQRAPDGQQSPDGAQPDPPEGWDRVGKYYGTDRVQQDNQQQPGQQAAATAANAQTRPASEAPADGRNANRQGAGCRDRRSASGIQHPGIGI